MKDFGQEQSRQHSAIVEFLRGLLGREGVPSAPNTISRILQYLEDRDMAKQEQGLPTDLTLARVQIELPALLTIPDFEAQALGTMKAIEFIYSVYALLYSGDADAVHSLINFLKEHGSVLRSPGILNTQLQYLLEQVNVEPLRVAALRYGSPGSVDLLGIGKVVEIVRDMVKDVIWRGAHEKHMAELERRSKEVELERGKLELESAAMENIEKKIQLVEKLRHLELSNDERHLVSSALFPKVLDIVNAPHPPQLTILAIDDLKV